MGMGIILTIATALINLGIQLWNSDEPVAAAVFFIVGGILYILASYYGLNTARVEIEERVEDYVNERLAELGGS